MTPSITAMARPGVGVGVVGMVGVAGMAGALIIVGRGAGGGIHLGTVDGTTLGMDLLGVDTIGHGTLVRFLQMRNLELEGVGLHVAVVGALGCL